MTQTKPTNSTVKCPRHTQRWIQQQTVMLGVVAYERDHTTEIAKEKIMPQRPREENHHNFTYRGCAVGHCEPNLRSAHTQHDHTSWAQRDAHRGQTVCCVRLLMGRKFAVCVDSRLLNDRKGWGLVGAVTVKYGISWHEKEEWFYYGQKRTHKASTFANESKQKAKSIKHAHIMAHKRYTNNTDARTRFRYWLISVDAV